MDVSFRLLDVAVPQWLFQPKPKAAFRLASFWHRNYAILSTHSSYRAVKKHRFVYNFFQVCRVLRFLGFNFQMHSYAGHNIMLHTTVTMLLQTGPVSKDSAISTPQTAFHISKPFLLN